LELGFPFSFRQRICDLIFIRRYFIFLVLLPLAMGAVEEKVLRIACFDFPASFNPVYATSETAQAVMNKIYQSLFYFDGQGKICPELVAAVARDEARLEISLRLKKGARFADGSALSSQDVVATVELLKNPLFEYPYLSDLEFLEKIEALDPLTLRIKLKGRFAPWENYLTFKILNAAEIKRLQPEKFRQHIPLGSGPYRLARLDEPRGFELCGNPYSLQPGPFAKIRYSVLRESRQAPLLLLNDETDAVEIHGDDAQTYSHLKNWQDHFRLLKYRKFGFTYLVFNLRNSLINRNVQRIFFNRLLGTDFLDHFLQGTGEKVFSPFLYLSAEKPPQPFHASPLSTPRKLRILTNSESVVRKQLVLFLCEEMKAFHIELQPVFVEYQTFLKYLKQGNFDLAVSAFLLDMDWNMKDILSSSGYFNYAGFSDAKMDAALEAGLHEMDAGKRRKIYERAHDLWLQSLPLIPLFSLNYYMGISRRIKIPRNPFQVVGSSGDFFFNLQGW
jgi:peptide/nickel transport system substrate-binding protein